MNLEKLLIWRIGRRADKVEQPYHFPPIFKGYDYERR